MNWEFLPDLYRYDSWQFERQKKKILMSCTKCTFTFLSIKINCFVIEWGSMTQGVSFPDPNQSGSELFYRSRSDIDPYISFSSLPQKLFRSQGLLSFTGRYLTCFNIPVLYNIFRSCINPANDNILYR